MDNSSTFDDINDDALLAMDHSMRAAAGGAAVVVVAAIAIHAPGEAMQYHGGRSLTAAAAAFEPVPALG